MSGPKVDVVAMREQEMRQLEAAREKRKSLADKLISQIQQLQHCMVYQISRHVAIHKRNPKTVYIAPKKHLDRRNWAPFPRELSRSNASVRYG